MGTFARFRDTTQLPANLQQYLLSGIVVSLKAILRTYFAAHLDTFVLTVSNQSPGEP